MDVKHPLIKDEELFFENLKSFFVLINYRVSAYSKWNLIPVTGMAPETLYVFALQHTKNSFDFDFFVTKYQKIPQTVDLYRISKIESKGKENSYKIEKVKTESINNLPLEVKYPAHLMGKTDAEIRDFLNSQEPLTDNIKNDITIINLKILIFSRPDLSRETLKVLMEKYEKSIFYYDIRFITKFNGNKNVALDFIEFFLEKRRNNSIHVNEKTLFITYETLFKHIVNEDLTFIKRVFEFLQTKNEKLAFLKAIIENGPKNALYFAMRFLRDQNPEVRDTAKRYIESLKS